MGNVNLFHILKQSEKEGKKRHILIIYDNADAFCKSGSSFRGHLRHMTKNIANAKFIFSTNTKIEDDYFTGESQNIQGIQILEKEDPNNYIKLEPLRMEEISELLKTYSLR